jgi:hypothetical protein
MSGHQTWKDLAAKKWFGYGSWDAPYWFIGKEPGGIDNSENYDSWARLGAADLIDCRDHDLEYRGENRGLWHLGVGGHPPKLQSTWRPLIALLLSYQGDADYDADRIRHYQIDHWGRSNGDTCVIELSAVAAPSTQSAEAKRLFDVENRIAVLREKIAVNKPEFVILYGTGLDPVYGKPYSDYWQKIAGVTLDVAQPKRVGSTVFCFTQHPTAHGLRNEFWTALGQHIGTMAVSQARKSST